MNEQKPLGLVSEPKILMVLDFSNLKIKLSNIGENYMNNFINVRIQSVSQNRLENNLVHNVRAKQSRNDINDNVNYLYKLEGQSYNRIELVGEESQNSLQELKAQYKQDREKHKKLYYDRAKYKMEENNGSWLEGVITFSEAIKHDLGNKYTTQDLEERAIKIVNEIANYFNVEPKSVVLHLSETTPHFHFYLQNFDDVGRSITHMFKSKKHFSHLQDIAFKHLQDLGMQRGIKKEVSFHRHQETKDYHEKEIKALNHKLHNTNEKYNVLKRDLLLVKDDLTKTISQLENVRDELKKGFDSLNIQKNTLKEVRRNLDKSSSEFSKVDSIVKELIKQEQTLRSNHQKVKDDIQKKQNDLKIVEDKQSQLESKFDRTNEYLENDIKQIKSKIIELVENSKDKGVFSDKIDEKKIKNLIYQEFKKVQTIYEDNRRLISKNQRVEEKFNTMYQEFSKHIQVVERNKSLEEKLKLKESSLEQYKKLNKDLDDENTKLRDKIYKLENKDKELNHHRHR